MVSEITDKGESLEELLGQVPDRHHALSRKGGVLSVNGRHPAPLDQWQPEYCGDIDMAISSDGTWYHEGIIIKRPELWPGGGGGQAGTGQSGHGSALTVPGLTLAIPRY